MSVNFNGGNLPKSALGLNGTNQNANPAPVNNENAAINGSELHTNDNNQTKGETLRGRVKVQTADGKVTNHGYVNDKYDYTIILNKDGSVKQVIKEPKKPDII